MNGKLLINKFMYILLSLYYFFVIFERQSTIGETFPFLIPLSTIVINGTLVFFVLYIIFFNRYKSSQIVIILMLYSIILFSAFKSGNQVLLSAITVCIAFKDFDIQKSLRISIFSIVIAFLIVLGLERIGIIDSNVIYRGAGLLRTSFGFLHPNIAGAIYLSIFIRYFETRQKIGNILITISILLFSIYFFIETDSNTLLVIAILTFFLQIFTNYFKSNVLYKKIIYYLGVWIAPILTLLSWILSYNYPIWKISNNLNDLLTGRIAYSKSFLDNYGISLFGQNIDVLSWADSKNIVGSSPMILDSSFMRLLINLGLIPSIIYFLLTAITVHVLFKKNELSLIVSIIIFQIFGFSQGQTLQITINYTLLLYGLAFKVGKNRENNNEKIYKQHSFSSSLSNN